MDLPPPASLIILSQCIPSGRGCYHRQKSSFVEMTMSGSAEAPSGRLSQHEDRWRSYAESMRAGDTEALGRLYDETSGIVYGFALRVLNNPADAEEVVLDVRS